MNWYVIDKDYVKHLYNADKKVGQVEYGNKLKLHIGILLKVNDVDYYVPISSPKPKHHNMSNSLDFHKLIDPATNTLYAVVNLNNMIPVPASCITQLKYNNVSTFRSFNSPKDETDYIYLLQKEKAIIDTLEPVLQAKANKLHNKCISKPDSSLAARCCDFALLENLCKTYTK